MKNKIFPVLLPLGVLFTIGGALFRIMHYPGADPVLLAGNGLILLFMFLYLTGKGSSEPLPEFFRKSIPYPFFIAGIIASLVAILMKIMHWPFANTGIVFGFGILITSCLIWMMRGVKNAKDEQENQSEN